MSRDNTYAYAYAVIEHHLLEFLAKSLPIALTSLTEIDAAPLIEPEKPFGRVLASLETSSRSLYGWNSLFPACAIIWIFLLFWRRTASRTTVQAMGALVLIALYGLCITTLAGYIDYDRLHTSFNPLLLLIIGCTIWQGSRLLARTGPIILCIITKDDRHCGMIEHMKTPLFIRP